MSANKNTQKKSYILMTPGPVPLPPEVLSNMALPMEHHRTPEFVGVWKRVLQNLKKVFCTQENVYIHTSTGSGGMESALVNTLSPGDHVLAIVSGKFGERWADMAEAFGAVVTRINVPWGSVVKVADVEAALKKNPKTVAVLCQACETSTAVLHPIRELARMVAQTPAIFMVDAITAMGATPLPMDEWQIDVLVAGSQKAFMLPTGLSFISFSKKAQALVETARCPRFYFDIRKEMAANAAGESYFSSAVVHVRALDLVLEIFLNKGLHRVFDRIQTLARATLLCAREMGLQIFPESPSPSVSALMIPEGIDGQKVRADMEKNDAIVVMGGQDQLKGKIVRIGHMGAISDDDLLKTMRSLANTINQHKPGTISEEKIQSAIDLAAQTLREAPAVVM
jgi:aspartate aminotransferase-like enzyme